MFVTLFLFLFAIVDMIKYSVYKIDNEVSQTGRGTTTYNIVPHFGDTIDVMRDLALMFKELAEQVKEHIHPERAHIGVDLFHPALHGGHVYIPSGLPKNLTGEVIFVVFIVALQTDDPALLAGPLTAKVTTNKCVN